MTCIPEPFSSASFMSRSVHVPGPMLRTWMDTLSAARLPDSPLRVDAPLAKSPEMEKGCALTGELPPSSLTAIKPYAPMPPTPWRG